MVTLNPGDKVVIHNKDSVYKDRVGEVSDKQDKVAGVFVHVSVADGQPIRRIWFSTNEIRVATS
jgi:hypothetical protein